MLERLFNLGELVNVDGWRHSDLAELLNHGVVERQVVVVLVHETAAVALLALLLLALGLLALINAIESLHLVVADHAVHLLLNFLLILRILLSIDRSVGLCVFTECSGAVEN